MITMRLSPENSEDLFSALLNDIKNSSLKYGQDFDHGAKEAIKQLDKVISELDSEGVRIFKDLLDSLRKELERLSQAEKSN